MIKLYELEVSLMAGFWFLVALVLFILWLSKKPKDQQGTTRDVQSSYDQGFWDGWRAFGRKVSSDLEKDTVSKDKLQQYIQAGATGIIPGDAETSPQPADQQIEPAEPTVQATPIVTVATPVATQPTPLAITPTPQDKERTALKNLNTMLYIASFLIVAAAAAFIASNTPEMVRLVLLWAVTVLFYGAGLLLYTKSKRLRPAAISFVGTGLAILPFAGLALSTLAGVPGQLAWFITSVTGIIAYGIATIRLRQAVIAYLTLAFVLSFASSSASMLQLPLVWGFVAIMVVALVAHFVATLWPKTLPSVFSKPIEQTGQYVTPLALFAAVFAITHLSFAEYSLIFFIAAFQYIVYWLGERTYVNETIARAFMTIALILLGFALGEGSYLFITIWQLAVICLSAKYSLIRVRPDNADSRQYESAWLWFSIIGLVLASTGWIAAGMMALGGTIHAVIAILTAGSAAIRLRRVEWAYICLPASIILPYSVGGWISGIDWYHISYLWIFLSAALVALWQYYQASKAKRSEAVKQFTITTFWLYIIIATIALVIVYSELPVLLSTLFAVIATVACTTFSYIHRQVVGEAIAIGYVALAIGTIVWQSSGNHTWHSLIIVGILYLILLAGGLIHAKRKEQERTICLLGAGQLVVLCLALGILQQETRLTAMLLLLAAAVGATVRFVFARQNTTLNGLYAISTIPYILLAWAGSLSLEVGWQVLVLVIAATIYWTISYRAKQPTVAVAANIAIIGAISVLLSWIKAPTEWTALLIGWLSAAVFASWYSVALIFKDIQRSWVHVIFLWLVLGATAVISLGEEKAVALSACGSIMLIAAVTATHSYAVRRPAYLDIALFIASFAVQSAIFIQWPNTPATIYGHLTTLTILGVALWRRRNLQPHAIHYVLAAGSLTLGAAISAFTDNSIYQLLFLIEHIIVLVIGGLKQWQKVVWWGVWSTVAAILYFLKDYFFLWLAFLGIVLIAIVIWRLNKINKAKQ